MEKVLSHLIIMLIAFLLIFCMAWLFAGICLRKDNVRQKVKDTKDFALARAYHRFCVWYKSAVLWSITEYAFVIVPFVSNVIVIYLTNASKESSNADVILLHSIISLSFVVFGYAISPQRQKKCYRKAFRCLDNSINEYLSTLNSGNSNPSILDKGIKKGEDFIDGSYDIE